MKRKKTVLEENAIAENVGKIDCIEIHNGRNISKEYDYKQNEIAVRYGIVPIIGSDAHTWSEIGRNYFQCDETNFSTSDGFMKALVRAQFHSRDCLLIMHQITKIVKMFKMFRSGEINEVYRIIAKKIKRGKC